MSGKGSFWAAKRQTDSNTTTLTTVSSSGAAVSSSLDAVSSSLDTVSSSLDSNVSSPLTILTSSYVTGAALTNSNTETALFTYTIPANTFNTGSVINVQTKVYMSFVTASAALTVRMRLSGSSGDVVSTMTTSAPITGDSTYLNLNLMGTEAPGSGSFISAGGVAVAEGTPTVPDFVNGVLFPTDQTLDLVLTGQWDTANSSSAHYEHFIATLLETQ